MSDDNQSSNNKSGKFSWTETFVFGVEAFKYVIINLSHYLGSASGSGAGAVFLVENCSDAVKPKPPNTMYSIDV